MARPYWSGQLRISLVAFGVKLFTATEAKSEIRFHQLSRTTGERIKYQKTVGGADAGGSGEPAATQVGMSDIVKGYEYRKGEYIRIEPREIENLRVPSKTTIDLTQFVDVDEVDPEFFEKPYFVTPENDAQTEAFAVVRKALAETKKIALGKIAFGGREHLVAIAPSGDDAMPGMMAYTMRYAEELKKRGEFFAEIKKVAVDEDQLDLAKELIKRKASKFEPEKFHDEYEAALRAMVEAKVNNVAPAEEEAPAPKSGKVINLMDALRKSVQSDSGKGAAPQEAPAVAVSKKKASAKGIALVKDEKPKAKTRKTA